MELAVSLSPHRHYYVYRLHRLLKRAGLEGRALNALRQVVRLCPDHPFYRYKLGRALLEEGRPQAATRHLQAATRLAPADGYYRLWLAIALFSANRAEEAVAAAEEGAALWDEYGHVFWALANRIHNYLGQSPGSEDGDGEPEHLSEYDAHLLQTMQAAIRRSGRLSAQLPSGLG
jgi:predicted Zn-dependent protease